MHWVDPVFSGFLGTAGASIASMGAADVVAGFAAVCGSTDPEYLVAVA